MKISNLLNKEIKVMVLKMLAELGKNGRSHHDRVRFISGMQGWFSIYKSINVTHQVNKMKDKNYTITSTEAEKASDTIQHLFMIKIISKYQQSVYRENIPQQKANTTLNGEKLKVFPLRSITRQDIYSCHFYFTQY